MSIRLQCNISKIEELQEIIQEYKKIINSKVINEYKMSEQELSKEGCAYADNILSNLNLKNKYIVIQYILNKENNEADKILVNIDLETRKKILSYIYWKYKRINSELKVDLPDIKTKFGIKRNESISKYITPLILDVKCSICGGKAEITRDRYDSFSNINFKCNICKHEEFQDNSSYSYSRYIDTEGFIKCNCETCKKIRMIFIIYIKTMLDAS